MSNINYEVFKEKVYQVIQETNLMATVPKDLEDDIIAYQGRKEFEDDARWQFLEVAKMMRLYDNIEDLPFDASHVPIEDIPVNFEFHDRGAFKPECVEILYYDLIEEHEPESTEELLTYLTPERLREHTIPYTDIRVTQPNLGDVQEAFYSLSEAYPMSEQLKDTIHYASELLKNQELLYQWSVSHLPESDKFELIELALSEDPDDIVLETTESFIRDTNDIDSLYQGQVKARIYSSDFTDIESFREGIITDESEPYDVLCEVYANDKIHLDLEIKEDVIEQFREYKQSIQDEYEDEY